MEREISSENESHENDVTEEGFCFPAKENDPPRGTIAEIDGRLCRWDQIDTGYTLRQYFSHSTDEKGAGPGWDWRVRLADHGFSDSQIFRPQNLPDIPYKLWGWIPVEK